jgi:hypothetical protein
VVKRLGVVTGEIEAEWKAYRLAVVSNKTPFFVPQATTPSPAPVPVPCSSSAVSTSNNATASSDLVCGEDVGRESNNSDTHYYSNSDSHNKKLSSVWDKILEKNNYEDAIDCCKNSTIMDGNKRFENRFPLLGIQRSATTAAGRLDKV